VRRVIMRPCLRQPQ